MKALIFGPNGSGKGTQGAVIKKKHILPHIESGVIFRENITEGTDLGKKAKSFVDRGELVPDDLTVPMILDRLKKDDCRNGWLLDGFPRNKNQAIILHEALGAAGLELEVVVEVLLDRQIAKNRIMGRRLCENDGNHPNNVFIETIRPKGNKCRVCGGHLSTRADDQDEDAINTRHDIYYDANNGTIAAAHYFKALAKRGGQIRYITLDGSKSVDEVSEELTSKL